MNSVENPQIPFIIILVGICLSLLMLSACATQEAKERIQVEGSLPFEGKLVIRD